MTVEQFAQNLVEALDKKANHHRDEARRWAHANPQVASIDAARAGSIGEIASAVRIAMGWAT